VAARWLGRLWTSATWELDPRTRALKAELYAVRAAYRQLETLINFGIANRGR
jgi:hypothetical protein